MAQRRLTAVLCAFVQVLDVMTTTDRVEENGAVWIGIGPSRALIDRTPRAQSAQPDAGRGGPI